MRQISSLVLTEQQTVNTRRKRTHDMQAENTENDFDLFADICIDDDSDSDDISSIFGKPSPRPPKEPETPVKFVDFEKYVEEKCENKIKILDRSTFHEIKRPIMICFNYFREKCFHQTKYLDRIYQLTLKYGDRIEFIVADRMDIDIIYPGSNPISFFCNLVDPERESLNTYVIDEKKRIHIHYDAYQTVETLSEVCEQLLNGTLYPSQPIPKKSDSLVKVCVHLNYDELVTNSTKDILLIVGLGGYKKFDEYEPDYERLADELKDCNLDIVYIDGDKNFVPFNLNANCYPTIIFVPHNDKDNFIHFSTGPRDTENMMKFIQQNIGPDGQKMPQKELTKGIFKPFDLPKDVDLKFEDLEHYVNENFPNSMKILDRSTLHNSKGSVIIHFMNFKEKGVAFYLDTLRRIHQVAEAKHYYGLQYLVADINDIDVMYPQWYKKYLDDPIKYPDIPKVFGIDRVKRVYEVDNFETASSLFFFHFDLTYSRMYRSQPWVISSTAKDVVKPCVANNLNVLIKKSKRDIFLTIYWPTYKASHQILKILNEISDDVSELNVGMLKMDAKLNYVPLEFSYPTYPVHFFIPYCDKDNGVIRYISDSQSRDDILEFIRENIQK